jgi:hypothetical protein
MDCRDKPGNDEKEKAHRDQFTGLKLGNAVGPDKPSLTYVSFLASWQIRADFILPLVPNRQMDYICVAVFDSVPGRHEPLAFLDARSVA